MGKDVIIALDFDSKEKTLAFLDRFTEEKPFVKIAAGFSQRQSSGHVQTTVVVRHCPAEVLTGIHRTHSTKRPGGCASLLLSP